MSEGEGGCGRDCLLYLAGVGLSSASTEVGSCFGKIGEVYRGAASVKREGSGASTKTKSLLNRENLARL